MPDSSLADALRACDVTLPDREVALLDHYCRLLWDRNQQLNLTRHLDYPTFVARDVVDSLQLANFLHAGESLLDIGSGGGVPGIPLAIVRPDLRVTLSESVGKKSRALSQMVAALGLPCHVVAGRAESALAETAFDVVAARAVGPLARILQWLRPHWSRIGRLLLVKGPRWVQERQEARHLGLLGDLELRRLATYTMPGTGSTSVILLVYRGEK
jgi:16S rRNA (guanine527-N7)-methyltransferase